MGKLLQENQSLVMWLALLVVPVLILGVTVIVQIKKQRVLTIVLTGILWVFLYDAMILGISIAVSFWGTSWLYLSIPVGIVPWVIAVLTYLLERKQFEFGSIAARILIYNVIYYLLVICAACMGLCILKGIDWLVCLGLLPIGFGFLLYFLLGRKLLVFEIGNETILLPSEHYEKKEVVDYMEEIGK